MNLVPQLVKSHLSSFPFQSVQLDSYQGLVPILISLPASQREASSSPLSEHPSLLNFPGGNVSKYNVSNNNKGSMFTKKNDQYTGHT